MLDVLPDEVWGKTNYLWLDPFCKSGIFLREIAARLLEGLSDQIPNFEERRIHIYRDMLWGTSITEMTGMISRRSLYYSRNAGGPTSVVQFENPEGNVPFIRADHAFAETADGAEPGSCRHCRAPFTLERGVDRENYAYSFIHGAYPTEEMKDMKFDVIVGNPPYQIAAEGTTRTMPTYQYFVERAVDLEPKYIVMITPSRWFTGGLGLDEFRGRMIADRRLSAIVDNPKLFDCFPGVEIKGGVSYFLWDRDHDGDCEFSTRVDGRITSTVTRDLRNGTGVVLRDNQAAEIVGRVRGQSSRSMAELVQPRLAFGERFRTNFRGSVESGDSDSIPIVFNGGHGYVAANEIERSRDLIGKWKVLIPKAGDGHGREESFVLGEPIALAPGSICTETYFVTGAFDSRTEAKNYAYYLATKFVRFLVLQRKATQDIRPEVFNFVPMLDMARAWTDADLYDFFSLTETERAYIERTIKPRTVNLSLDSPIPASHRPGGAKYKSKGLDDE